MSVEPENTAERLDPAMQGLYRALAAAASLSSDHAAMVVLRLLQTLQREAPAVRLALAVDAEAAAAVAGLSEDDLYEIYSAAYEAYQDGKLETALRACESLMLLTPGHRVVLGLMAACYTELGRYDKALRCVEGALDDDEARPDDVFQKAYLLYRTGELERAAVTLQAMLETDPDPASDTSQISRGLLSEIQDLLRG
jgi:tetratricopeptide (TPR) repeat protein